MKMAKPTEEDYRSVVGFLNDLELIIEERERPDDMPEEFDPRSANDVDAWLHRKWRAVGSSWRRVVFGGQVCIANACDPDCDVLEFKPEIKAAMAAQKATP